jgi:hypothetical protein
MRQDDKFWIVVANRFVSFCIPNLDSIFVVPGLGWQYRADGPFVIRRLRKPETWNSQ